MSEELYDLPKEAKAFNNSKSIGELTVGVTLQGYEDLKESLNDIESQLDRIIEKQDKIKGNEKKQSVEELVDEMSKYINTRKKSAVYKS